MAAENVRTGFDLVAKIIIGAAGLYLSVIGTNINTGLAELKTQIEVVRTRFEKVDRLEKTVEQLSSQQSALQQQFNDLRIQIASRGGDDSDNARRSW
jgi:hypothetical protein